MDIKNLSKGIIIKNYKELCGLLGVIPTTGNGRKYHIKEFERYCAYEKQGQKFIVTEVFKEIKPKNDNRIFGNNSIYSNNISDLILDLLAQSEEEQLFLSAGALLQRLDMINCNYIPGRRYIAKLSELIEVPEANIYDFYNYTQSKLKSNLENALNYLRKKALIIWSKEVTICIRNAKIKINELENIKIDDLHGKYAYYKTALEHRKAKRDEKRLILKTEKEVLKELNCEDMQQVFITGLWNVFTKRINKILQEKANIEYYYNSYEIIYNHDSILEELGSEEKTHIKNILTKNVKEGLVKSATTRHRTAIKKYNEYELQALSGDESEHIAERIKLHKHNEYIVNTNILINNTIDISAHNLGYKLKQPCMNKGIQDHKDYEDNNIPF